jgi:hypothetical protein
MHQSALTLTLSRGERGLKSMLNRFCACGSPASTCRLDLPILHGLTRPVRPQKPLLLLGLRLREEVKVQQMHAHGGPQLAIGLTGDKLFTARSGQAVLVMS